MHRSISGHLNFQFKLNRHCRGQDQGQGHGEYEMS